jgi:hypothetical protein
MMQKTAGVTGRSNHIDIQFHFVRNRYIRKGIDVVFVPTTQRRTALRKRCLAQLLDRRLIIRDQRTSLEMECWDARCMNKI